MFGMSRHNHTNGFRVMLFASVNLVLSDIQYVLLKSTYLK